MKSRIFFTDMKPVGKGRHRFTRTGRTYTPSSTKDAQEVIQWAYKAKYGGARPLVGPLSVLIVATCRLPKSMPKRIESDDYTVKPDVDNIAKLVLDALNKLAYKDDVQIIELTVKKNPRTRNVKQGVLVKISETGGH